MKAPQSFDAWMKKVNDAIADRLGGLTADDLSDCPYSEWHEDGVSAKSAASRAIKRAGQ
jgi:hypothetical protein